LSSKLAVIRTYPAVIHAELAKSALQAYGIECAIDSGSFSGVPGRFGGVQLRVREEDVEAALKILGPEEKFSS